MLLLFFSLGTFAIILVLNLDCLQRLGNRKKNENRLIFAPLLCLYIKERLKLPKQ
jgi:hypothetical protein